MKFTDSHGGATIKRPDGTDPYGNPLPGDEITVSKLFVAPAGSSEWTSNRMTTETKYDLYLPPYTDIQPWDELVFDAGNFEWSGRACQVEGDPADWSVNPITGNEFGVVALLKSSKG